MIFILFWLRTTLFAHTRVAHTLGLRVYEAPGVLLRHWFQNLSVRVVSTTCAGASVPRRRTPSAQPLYINKK